MAKLLIIGAGGAGLSAALEAKAAGFEVVVATKEYPTRSQTCMAQGGINAALADGDSVDKHKEDTLKSAKGLADEAMVERLCASAPDTISWLEQLGVPFSRTKEAKIAQRKLGGASFARACYAQDYSGLKILHTLYDQALSQGIVFLCEYFLIDLIVKNDECFGALFYDLKNGKLEAIYADNILLAGGGYSKIYGEYSTNSKAATGDIIAAALRAGAKLRMMEFIQFHPTALKKSSILIGEAARGAGGRLINSDGERFVDELKPRDEVSLAIFEQLEQNKEVFLDISHLEEQFINEELPQERKLALLYEGVDIAKEQVPIKPAAHFTMGGIAVDEKFQTNIKNLFAVGECSESKVHGANRLGGNALLEIITFGRDVVKYLSKEKRKITPKQEQNILEQYLYQDGESFYPYQKQLQEMMYQKCGIKRNKKDLEELLAFIEELEKKSFGLEDKTLHYNTNLTDLLSFYNMLALSKEVVLAALSNKKSVGAHYRVDGE